MLLSQSYTSERRNRTLSDGTLLCHVLCAVGLVARCPDEAAVPPAADELAACPAVPLLEAPCAAFDLPGSGSFLPAAARACAGGLSPPGACLFSPPWPRRRFLTIEFETQYKTAAILYKSLMNFVVID